MYIKTKKVLLKSGKIQKYFYLAKSVRKGKRVYPKIIKYLGKEVPKNLEKIQS